MISASSQISQRRGAVMPTRWCLVGSLPGEATSSKLLVSKFPFSIGRTGPVDLELPSRNVSKRHAELLATDELVLIRDLGSTNGTFVNGQRITAPTPVGDGDLLQFADVEFRLTQQHDLMAEQTCIAENTEMEQSWLISRMHDVLNMDGLTMVFQPIVLGSDARPFAYEALVRSTVSGLESPLKLFSAAERLGLEEQLSRKCRVIAVQLLDAAGVPGTLFVNTHPHERLDAELLKSLLELRQLAGARPLVLEIHEDGVADFRSFRAFREELRQLDIGLAYDDFGVGQARLRELGEVPPDFLKFDRSLLIELDSPTAMHRNLVETLHRHARDLGICTVAEGLDRPEAAAVCSEMGFTHFQGFLFGRPQPAAHWL